MWRFPRRQNHRSIEIHRPSAGLFDAHTHLCMTMKKERDGNNYYFTTILDPTPLPRD